MRSYLRYHCILRNTQRSLPPFSTHLQASDSPVIMQGSFPDIRRVVSLVTVTSGSLRVIRRVVLCITSGVELRYVGLW